MNVCKESVWAGLTLAAAVGLSSIARGDDWTRFRGPNGTGVASGEQAPPASWGDSQNIKWKIDLPGPGSSSPIIVGDRVFVTCWSGYGVDPENVGDPANLKRHLICLDRATGKTVWEQAVPANLPEDSYRGMFAEHGYASHTPVSDGERVYAFFGKSGVFAYDWEGKELWRAEVGTELDERKWGTASSPILYENLLIVPAFVESSSLIAFDKLSGAEVWRKEAKGFDSCWSTPILVDLPGGGQELAVSVPMEIWGFDPASGAEKWRCRGPQSDSMCSSAVADAGVVYALESGPRGGGAVAVRAGGSAEVSDSHVVWQAAERNRIATPLVHQGYLYWISGKVVHCLNASDGSGVYENRLEAAGAAVAGRPAQGAGGRRRGPGGQDYGSPVAAGDRVYYVARNGTAFVFKAGPQFELLSVNQLTDPGDCSATPAISGGELFLRSSRYLYCIAE